MNTFWISTLFGAPFLSLLPPRAMQAVGMGIMEIIVIRVMVRYLPALNIKR